MKTERTKNASRNMLFGVALKLYQIIMPFAIRSVILYYLGVEYLGLNSLFTSVLQVLNMAELGVGSAMVFSMYKPIAQDDNATICALMKLYKWYYRVIGAVILVAGVAITPFIPKLIKGDVPPDMNVYVLYLMNLAATVLTYWLFAYRNSVLQAHQRGDVASKVGIATETLKYILQLGALCFFKNYYYFVLVLLLTQIITNVVTAICSKRMYPQFDPKGRLPKEQIKEINCRIKDLFTAKFGGTIVNSADTIVISAFLGLAPLAVYQNYYFIMNSVISLIVVLLGACTAGIGNSIVTESLDKNYADFKKFALMEIWVSGICVCCFLNLYQPFMTMWMGKENLLSMGCVVLFCLYFYLYVTNQYMCTYKDAAGIWHEDRLRPLCGAMVNLVLNLALVKFIGIFAILLSTVLSYILVAMPWLIHNLFTVLFKRSCREFLKKALYDTVAVAVAAAASYGLCLFVGDGIVGMILRLIISVVVSNVVLFLLMGRGEDFRGMLDIVDTMTKNKLCAVTNLLRKRA